MIKKTGCVSVTEKLDCRTCISKCYPWCPIRREQDESRKDNMLTIDCRGDRVRVVNSDGDNELVRLLRARFFADRCARRSEGLTNESLSDK